MKIGIIDLFYIVQGRTQFAPTKIFWAILTYFMGRLGFEPKTIRLKAECSTAELATRCVFVTRFTNVAEEIGKCNLFYKKLARIVTEVSMVCWGSR